MTLADWLLLGLAVVACLLIAAQGRSYQATVARLNEQLRGAYATAHELDELVGHQNATIDTQSARIAELTAAQAPAREPLTDDQLKTMKASRCAHCGGVHASACPRVRSLRFRPDGGVSAVEFWPDGQWDRTRVLFIEDFTEPTAPTDT